MLQSSCFFLRIQEDVFCFCPELENWRVIFLGIQGDVFCFCPELENWRIIFLRIQGDVFSSGSVRADLPLGSAAFSRRV